MKTMRKIKNCTSFGAFGVETALMSLIILGVEKRGKEEQTEIVGSQN